jgi:hypothetical protein
VRQAIQTKYFGPTTYRGSRIKATAYGGSITVGWDHALNVEENHSLAAHELAKKLGWTFTQYQGGSLKDGSYVWVEVSK